MMCSETEGSHFKMYCKSTNKICRPKVFFFKLSSYEKFIISGNWFNDGECCIWDTKQWVIQYKASARQYKISKWCQPHCVWNLVEIKSSQIATVSGDVFYILVSLNETSWNWCGQSWYHWMKRRETDVGRTKLCAGSNRHHGKWLCAASIQYQFNLLNKSVNVQNGFIPAR